MKALSVRLDDRLARQFDAVCEREGYKKNGIMTRLIQLFVKQRSVVKVTSHARSEDPFLRVIGILQGPLLKKGESIDDLVYDLRHQ